MPIERIFLGWDRPVLDTAAEYLITTFTRNGWEVDLSKLLVVTPGARAARNLLGRVIDVCAQRGLACGSPVMMSPGQLPMRAVVAQAFPPASDTARHLAWRTVLATADPAELAPLVPFRPAALGRGAWDLLAETIASLHNELCGEMLTFRDIPHRAAKFAAFTEDSRWTAASLVQNRYVELLKKWSLHDPAWSSMHALRDTSCVPSELGLVLVGAVELGAAARRVAELMRGTHRALIFAPESAADSFDSCGCIRVDRPPLPTDLQPGWVTFVDSTLGQADAAFASIARASSQSPLSSSDVVIGVPDESVIPSLVRRADQIGGVRVRSAAGQPAASTPPGRFLEVVQRLVEGPSLGAILDWARHESVNRWLCQSGNTGTEWWLAALDDHAASSFDDALPDHRSAGPVRKGLDRLACLKAASSANVGAGPGELVGLAEAVLADLRAVFGDVAAQPTVPADRVIVAACLAVRDELAELSRLSENEGAAAGFEFPATIAEVLAHVCGALQNHPIPDEPSADAVELLGWLEIPFDPAPVLVLTGMNEGIVPSRSMADPFLPDGLRNFLGISCDARRVCRDAYLLSTATRCRRSVSLIAARRDAEGAPLLPSRLLMRGETRTVVDRMGAFVGSRPGAARPSLKLTPGGVDGFCRPLEPEAVCVRSMRVTDFGKYLASPYRFYLERVLFLKEAGEPADELDPFAFGTLLHETLKEFGRGPARDETRQPRIEEAVNDAFDEQVANLVGPLSSVPAAVGVQVEFARARLREVARVQAERREEGWRIGYAEWEPEGGELVWESAGGAIGLRGRIDRIDVHESTGRIAILDYKTGDHAGEPAGEHLVGNRWKDFQLPLYRHLASILPEVREALESGKVDLGYFSIPRRAQDVGVLIAEWDRGILADADRAAASVVAAVRAGDFAAIGDAAGDDGARGDGGSLDRLCGVGFMGEFAPLTDDEPEECA